MVRKLDKVQADCHIRWLKYMNTSETISTSFKAVGHDLSNTIVFIFTYL
jgi:hypothetical protein